jgi:16S rRNA (adenine1518-N6/adenine1519-N6)-dimethyltransferase
MATHGRRRALGQHFLKDIGICQAIADAAIEESRKHHCIGLLEIGPGKGAITQPILQRLSAEPAIQKFVLVERDARLAQFWKEQEFPPGREVQVRIGDFMEIPTEQWLVKSPLAVVSNLPYSAGTAIVTRLAQETEKIPVMVLMFQAEVAKRLRAAPSTKERGSLSVWIQNRWDVRKLLFVPPKAFSPPPEVDSEVVVLTRRETPWIQFASDSKEEKLWESLLRACFAHRRKMLRSVVPWRNALELSGVDGTKRAEALDWPEWARLYEAVKEVNQAPRS